MYSKSECTQSFAMTKTIITKAIFFFRLLIQMWGHTHQYIQPLLTANSSNTVAPLASVWDALGSQHGCTISGSLSNCTTAALLGDVV